MRPTICAFSALEQGPGAGGEILQAGADGEHHVGLLGERVGGAGAGDADRAHVERMIMGDDALAGLRLADRNAVLRGEGGERLLGLRIQHAAAGDDERLPARAFSAATAAASSSSSGRGAALGPDPLREEALGIVEGLGLHVLAERQRHRAAFGRIGQHGHGAGSAGMICSGRVMRSK